MQSKGGALLPVQEDDAASADVGKAAEALLVGSTACGGSLTWQMIYQQSCMLQWPG